MQSSSKISQVKLWLLSLSSLDHL